LTIIILRDGESRSATARNHEHPQWRFVLRF
jgi:hypothetical protein